ncbi:MAG: histidine kinase N-terminal 7TM domain-containing protein [Patescibacteria group bacterium]
MEINPGIYHSLEIQIIEVTSVICFFALLVISITVFIKSKKRPNLIFFGSLVLSLSVWLFANIMSDLVGGKEAALLWARLTFLGPAFSPTLFLLFAYTLYKKKTPFSWWQILLLFLPSIAIVAIVPTRYNISDVEYIENYGYRPSISQLYPAYIIYLLIYAFFGLKKLFNIFKSTTSKVTKIQLRYIIFAFICVATFSLLFNLLLPSLGYNKLYPLSLIGLAVFTWLIAYAILRYRFMDVRIVMKKGAAHTLVLILLLIVYGYLVLLANDYLVQKYAFNRAFVNFASVLVIAVTFIPFRKWLIRIINRLFFSRQPNMKQMIEDVRQRVIGLVDLEEFCRELSGEILKVVNVNRITCLIVNKRQGTYDSLDGNISIRAEEALPSFLKDSMKMLIREEIPYLFQEAFGLEQRRLEQCEKEMDNLKTEAVLPLATRHGLSALVLLGSKTSNEPYTTEDVRYLQNVAQEAAYALENVILYKNALERIGVKV